MQTDDLNIESNFVNARQVIDLIKGHQQETQLLLNISEQQQEDNRLLRTENSELRTENRELRTENEQQKHIIKELEQRIADLSHNTTTVNVAGDMVNTKNITQIHTMQPMRTLASNI